jgi:hypothetical protein
MITLSLSLPLSLLFSLRLPFPDLRQSTNCNMVQYLAVRTVRIFADRTTVLSFNLQELSTAKGRVRGTEALHNLSSNVTI